MSSDGSGTSNNSKKRAALVVSGAAGKGPYAAGALHVLAEHGGFEVQSLMGASSGALNAAVYAAGLRVGKEREAAALLCELWEKRAHWFRILTHTARVSIVEEALRPFAGDARVRPVALEVVVANLRGEHDGFGEITYERHYSFDACDFEDRARLRRMAEVCVASAAIPVVFAPSEIDGASVFWDGGIVNNTPIGRALKAGPDIDHVVVITPSSNTNDGARGRYGRFAVNRLLEVLISERLSRDLHEAKSFNVELQTLLNAGVDPQLLAAMRWKILKFVEIRPGASLAGNLATGFFDTHRRREYIATGRAAAQAELARVDQLRIV